MNKSIILTLTSISILISTINSQELFFNVSNDVKKGSIPNLKMIENNIPLESTCGTRTVTFNGQEEVCQNNKNVGVCNVFTFDKPSCIERECMGPLKMNLNIKTDLPDKNCCKKCKCYGDPHCIDFNKNEKSFVTCDARKIGKTCKLDKETCEKQIDYNGKQCKWIQTNMKAKWNVGILGSPCVSDSSNPLIKMYIVPNKVYENSFYIEERGTIVEIVLTLDKQKFHMNSTECFNPNYFFEIDDRLAITKKSFVFKQKGIKPDVMYQIYHNTTGITTVVKCQRNYDSSKKIYGKPRLEIEVIDPEERNTDSYCDTGKLDTGLAHDTKRTDKIEASNLCPNYQYSNEIYFAQELSKVTGDSVVPVTTTNIQDYMQMWCSKNMVNTDTNECFEIIRLYGWLKTWCSINTLQTHPINCVDKCQSCIKDVEDFGFTEVSSTYINSYKPSEEEICSTSLLPSKKGLECENILEIQTFNGKEWVTEGFMRTCANIKFNSIDNPRLFFNQMRIVQCTVDCPEKKCEYMPSLIGKIEFKKEPKMCVCEYEE